MILLLIVSISTKAIVNQNPVKPGCPAVNPQENLLLERFAGVWYEVQKHFSQFELGSCVSVNIGLLKELNSTILSLRHNQKIGGNFTDFDQNATVRRINSVWSFKYNSSLMGEFNLHLFYRKSNSLLNFLADFDGYIYILETNFVNYAVVYACGLINLKQKGQMV